MLSQEHKQYLEKRYFFINNVKLGNSCPDGWFSIIDALCEEILKLPNIPSDFKFTQVKEKFGALRVYTNWNNDIIDSHIRDAEDESRVTCQFCGEPGKLTDCHGWLKTVCNKHE